MLLSVVTQNCKLRGALQTACRAVMQLPATGTARERHPFEQHVVRVSSELSAFIIAKLPPMLRYIQLPCLLTNRNHNACRRTTKDRNSAPAAPRRTRNLPSAHRVCTG